jgi:hypothetical protein
VFGEEPRRERGHERAEMERPGGSRSEPAADGCHLIWDSGMSAGLASLRRRRERPTFNLGEVSPKPPLEPGRDASPKPPPELGSETLNCRRSEELEVPFPIQYPGWGLNGSLLS